MQLWDETIVQKTSSPEVQAFGLAYLFSKLDESGRASLKNVVSDRARIRSELAKYLETRTAQRAAIGSGYAEFELQGKVEASLEAILASHSTSDGKNAVLQQLHEVKDQNVFKVLAVIADPAETIENQSKAREEVVKKVGSKTQLGEYLKTLCRRCSMGSFGRENLEAVMNLCVELKGKDQTDTLELLTIVAKAAPGAFKGLFTHMEKLYTSAKTQESGYEAVLKLLAMAGKALDDNPPEQVTDTPSRAKPSRKAKKVLEDFALKLYIHGVETTTPAQAKLAVKAMGALLPEESTALDRLAEELASPSSLKPDNPCLQVVLEAAGSLARIRPGCFFERAQVFRKFIKEQILLQKDLPVCKASGKKSKKSSYVSSYSDILSSSIKLLVSLVVPLPVVQPGGHISEEDEFRLQASGFDLFELLFGILEKGGTPPSGKQLQAKELAEVRLAAALGILKMSTNQYLQRYVTPKWWHTLAWTAQDTTVFVRHAFVEKLCSFVRKGRMPLRFISYLCLCATEPSELRKEAAHTFLLSINMRRKAIASSQAKLHESSFEAENEDGVDQKVRSAMPEYVVPYVIHLLAYHPACPTSPSESPELKKHEKYVSFILEPLIQSLGADADNLAFLLQIVNTIQTNYVDALQPYNKKIHLVAHLATGILRKLIKTQENLKPYPGTIYLPAPLFQRRPLDTHGVPTLLPHELQTAKTPQPDPKTPRRETLLSIPESADASSEKESGIPLVEDTPFSKLQSPDEDDVQFEVPNWGSPVTYFETSATSFVNGEASVEMSGSGSTKKTSSKKRKKLLDNDDQQLSAIKGQDSTKDKEMGSAKKSKKDSAVEVELSAIKGQDSARDKEMNSAKKSKKDSVVADKGKPSKVVSDVSSEPELAVNGFKSPPSNKKKGEPQQVQAQQPSYQKGEKVEAAFNQKSRWYPATISALMAGETYKVTYDDGDTEEGVPARFIRKKLEPQITSPRASRTSRGSEIPQIASAGMSPQFDKAGMKLSTKDTIDTVEVSKSQQLISTSPTKPDKKGSRTPQVLTQSPTKEPITLDKKPSETEPVVSSDEDEIESSTAAKSLKNKKRKGGPTLAKAQPAKKMTPSRQKKSSGTESPAAQNHEKLSKRQSPRKITATFKPLVNGQGSPKGGEDLFDDLKISHSKKKKVRGQR